MSARLERSIARAVEGGGSGLVPYLTAGDGGFDATLGALEACAALDVAAVELGLPFREPVADGPTLIAAAQRALAAGANLERYLECARTFRREGHTTPLLAFAYANALFSRDVEALLEALRGAGFDGLMVPDLPFEESEAVLRAAEARGLSLIQFAAPTTGEERLARIAPASSGFLYLVARTGTTGRASAIDGDLRTAIERARRLGAARVGVGFGLRDPEQLRALRGAADLAIVGSALVARLHGASGGTGDPRTLARAAAADFLSPLSNACRCSPTPRTPNSRTPSL